MPPIVDFEDILWDSNTENMGGAQTQVLYAPVEDFDPGGIPTTPAPTAAADLAALATIATDFTFAVGKGFRKLYGTMDTIELVSEAVGEIDGMSFENKMEINHPGSVAAALGFARRVNNGSFIFVLFEANGQKRIIGSEAFPAKIESQSITTGKATSDKKGITMTIKDKAAGPAPIYTGAIVYHP